MPIGADLTKHPLLRDVPVYEGYRVLGDVVLYERLGERTLSGGAEIAREDLPANVLTFLEQPGGRR